MRSFRILLGLCALLLLAATTASGQNFDPDPSEPDARQQAEFRFVGAMLGMMPPPVGWTCTLEPVPYGQIWLTEARCEPDPALIEQQERERREWEERLARRSESLRRRR